MVELDDLADEHGDLRPGALAELARDQQRLAEARTVPRPADPRREPVRPAAAGRRREQPQADRQVAAGRPVEQYPATGRIIQVPAIIFGPPRVTVPGPIAGVLLVFFGILVGLQFGRGTQPAGGADLPGYARAELAQPQPVSSRDDERYTTPSPELNDVPLIHREVLPQSTARIAGNRVRLREGPSLSASILSVFDDGASVRVLGETNGWCQVAASSGLEGFVFGSYVRGPAGRECRPAVTLQRLVGAGVDLPTGEKVLVSGRPTPDSVTLLLPNQMRVQVPSYAIATVE